MRRTLSWKGVIFDWDGVIVDSSALHKKSWENLADELKRPLPHDHFAKGFGKRNETIIPDILNWTKDATTIDRWGKRKEELYRELANSYGIKLAPGSREFLQRTTTLPLQCAIGTSTERKNVQLAIEQHDLSGFFVGAVCSEDVKSGKPDPEVFLKAAQILSLSPQECVVFEDSPHGIEAAIRAGIKTVALTTSHPSNSFMHLKPDLLIDSLAGLDPNLVNQLFDPK